MKKKVWKFKLENYRYFDLQKYIGKIEDCIFYDFVNEIWQEVGSIQNGWLKILKGYEWDGCTPKLFSLFGHWIGIPDFRGTYNASLVHDFLIEYCRQHSINRKKIDTIFQKIMEEEKFVFSFAYSSGVHLFRPIALAINKCPKDSLFAKNIGRN